MRRVGVFDTETTGVDPETETIVSAIVGVLNEQGELDEARAWLIRPDVDIPAGATAVHGITTEHARANGMDPLTALTGIEAAITMILSKMPLVIFNAPYDLTILDRNLRRIAGHGLSITPMPIIDPFVLDKAMDKFRPGKRTLAADFQHWTGKALEGAHGAEADAVAAGQIGQLLLMDYRLADGTDADIHRWQITWKRRQAESFREYLAKNGKPFEDVSLEWPILTYREQTS